MLFSRSSLLWTFLRWAGVWVFCKTNTYNMSKLDFKHYILSAASRDEIICMCHVSIKKKEEVLEWQTHSCSTVLPFPGWQVNLVIWIDAIRLTEIFWGLCSFVIDRNVCDSIHLSWCFSSIFHLLLSLHLPQLTAVVLLMWYSVMLQRPRIPCLSPHNRLMWILWAQYWNKVRHWVIWDFLSLR